MAPTSIPGRPRRVPPITRSAARSSWKRCASCAICGYRWIAPSGWPFGAARNKECWAREPMSSSISRTVSDMHLRPEHEKLSVYLNLDGGSGKIRGIYLRHNEMARPIFEDWFAALKDLTSGTVSIRDIDKPVSSDHLAFDEIGLPAFCFLQDPLDSETRITSYEHGYIRPNSTTGCRADGGGKWRCFLLTR